MYKSRGRLRHSDRRQSHRRRRQQVEEEAWHHSRTDQRRSLASCEWHLDQQVGRVAQVGSGSHRDIQCHRDQDHESDRPASPPQTRSGHRQGRRRQREEHLAHRLPLLGVRDRVSTS